MSALAAYPLGRCRPRSPRAWLRNTRDPFASHGSLWKFSHAHAPFCAPLSKLQRPEVGERLARVVAQRAGLGVAARENERIENCFSAARLAGLRQAGRLIRVEWIDLLPEPDALDDVLDQAPFRTGYVALPE